MRRLLFPFLITFLPLAVCPAQTIEESLKQLESSDALDRLAAEIALVKAGHEPTIDRLAEEYLADPIKGGDALVYPAAASVKTLPGLFKALPRASPECPPTTGDVSRSSPKTVLAYVILQVISRTTEFPEETRKWAKGTRRVVFSGFGARQERDEKGFADMEEWWRRNGAAIVAGDLKAATWLPP